jgi:hypothetical protein
VYHVTEPEVAAQVPPAVYAQEVGVAQMVLDTAGIVSALQDARSRGQAP